jgi:hypothetical protein
MELTTITQITNRLRQLPADKLAEVYDFVNFLFKQEESKMMLREKGKDYVLDTMLASEDVLRRDWDTPEENEAWANL